VEGISTKVFTPIRDTPFSDPDDPEPGLSLERGEWRGEQECKSPPPPPHSPPTLLAP
jgi:hypothetical protein